MEKPEKFNLSFDELNISLGCVEKVIGYEEGEVPAPFDSIIHNVFNEVHMHADIMGAFVMVKDVRIEKSNSTLISGNKTFNMDNQIIKMLDNMESMVLLQCTAGKGIEQWAKQVNDSGDTFKGYVIDVLGSEIVDAAVLTIRKKIEKRLQAEGLNVTRLISPGYCGWPVDDQKVLFSFFSENYCGIRLTPSALMDPIKSISAMMGVGKKVTKQSNEHVCSLCSMDDCIYRYKRHQRQ